MSNDSNKLYEFDGYLLNAKEGNLWRGKEHIQMPAKAFDTLLMLVERHGEVLSKEEMLDTIWEGAFVEENNLSQKISILRRIFGKDKEFIQTVPKVGFRFVEPVALSSIEADSNVTNISRSHITGEGDSLEDAFSEFPSVRAAHTKQDSLLSDNEFSKSSSRRLLYPAMATLTAIILGALAFNFYTAGEDSISKIPSASFDYVEITDTGDVISSAISPDAKFIAFTKKAPRGEIDGKTTLRLLEIESKNDIEIPITENLEPSALKFSPDGKSIYFRIRGKRLQFENIYRISILGGKPELIAEKIWGFFSISPDGKKLLYYKRKIAGAGRRIVIRGIESGEEEIVSTPLNDTQNRFRAAPVFSPDQKLIAFVDPKKNNPNLAVVNIETNQVKRIKTDPLSISGVVWNPDGKSLYFKSARPGKSYQIWNVSYPDGETTRVTSDSDSYRNLNIANDGTISVDRLNMYSNLWLVPDADIKNARQITHGENGIRGLITAEFIPTGEILFNARDKDGAGIRVFNPVSNTIKPLTDKKLRTDHYFSYAKEKRLLFFEFKNRIWQRNFDGSEEKQINLGEATQILQPAVSHDEKWLYYVQRENDTTSIWKSPVEGGSGELVFMAKDFSPDTFLSASPDGKYLAFDYVKAEKIGDKNRDSTNVRKFGFLDLRAKKVRVIEVPAYNPVLRWANGGKSFDFSSFTKAGTAILRKDIDSDGEPAKIFEVEDEIIFRFDWSPDGKDLVIGRGNLSLNVAILRVPGSKNN